MFQSNPAWRTPPPDYTDIHWHNEWAERATIKAIVDGTSHARVWSDIQSTWGWLPTKKRKSKGVRVEKRKKVNEKRPPIVSMYRLLMKAGKSREEAVKLAKELLW